MPIAWHNPVTNLTSLISATDCTYASIGSTLGKINPKGTDAKCRAEVFTAANLTTPWSFANHQWVQAVVMFPNGTGAALIHSEFHGDEVGNASMCSSSGPDPGKCQYWSTGLGLSNDGGGRWVMARPPPRLATFEVPRVYVPDQPLTGFGAIGAVLQHDDGYFYGHVYQINAGTRASDTNTTGICAFRTRNLGDPQSFRGWNGTSWSVIWVNPYSASPAVLAVGGHVCTVINPGSRNSHPSARRFAGDWRPAGWPSHLLLGWVGTKVTYSFPAWDERALDAPFTAWTDESYMDITSWMDPMLFHGQPLMYPSLLDHDSPFELGRGTSAGLSYGLLGNKSAHLYFVIGRKYIARLPVSFAPAGTPVPPGPFPPAPPPPVNPQDCTEFNITGAGVTGVNGVYCATDDPKSFSLNPTHQLYEFGGEWKLGHRGDGPVWYFGVKSTAVGVPITGWTGDQPPAPKVVCARN